MVNVKARLAGLAGIVFAIASVFITFGVSLVAMLAIGIAWAVARRRKRPLTRGVSWLVGSGTIGVITLMVAAIAMTRIPKSAFTELGRSIDSTAAAPPPPMPEWVRRVTPPAAQQQSPFTDSLVRSRAFTIWTMAMGGVMLVGLLAAYAGTLGWVAAMLGIYGATGNWLPRAEPVGPPPLGELVHRRAADVGPP
jgi:hypothetical protein